MPANHKVSVAWQIVFTFLPIVNLWAFYRIRRLTKYFLYVVLPSFAFSVAIIAILVYWAVGGGFFGTLDWQGAGYSLTLEPHNSTFSPGTYEVVTGPFNETITVDRDEVTNGGILNPLPVNMGNILYAASIALQGFSIYLVIIWSRQHNRQFDQSTTQTQSSA